MNKRIVVFMRSLPSIPALVTTAVLCGGIAQPAGAVDCAVAAYDAYHRVTQAVKGPFNRTLHFGCRTYWDSKKRVRFEADPEIGLSCTGDTAGAHSDPAKLTVEWFATPGASMWTSNGWHITGYEVAGGAFEKRRRRDSLILFDVKVPGKATSFTYTVTSIMFSKEGGQCDNVVAEALNWAG